MRRFLVGLAVMGGVTLGLIELHQVAYACVIKCSKLETSGPERAQQNGEFTWNVELFTGTNDSCSGSVTFSAGPYYGGLRDNVDPISVTPSSEAITGDGEYVYYTINSDLHNADDVGTDAIYILSVPGYAFQEYPTFDIKCYDPNDCP